MCSFITSILTEQLYNREPDRFSRCVHAWTPGSIISVKQGTHLLEAGSKLCMDGTIGIERLHSFKEKELPYGDVRLL